MELKQYDPSDLTATLYYVFELTEWACNLHSSSAVIDKNR